MHLRVENIRQVPLGGETLGSLDEILEILFPRPPLDQLTIPSVSLLNLIYPLLVDLVNLWMSGRSPAKEMIANTLRAV